MKKSYFTITLLTTVLIAFGQSDRGHIVKGNEYYKQKAFDKAAVEYKKALEKNDKSAEARYNLGNALYLMKKPAEAMDAYDVAFENDLNKISKSKTGYNKGVVLTRDNKLPECIDAYKQALRLNPEDKDARENLQKALNELKKQNKQNQQNQDNKNNQDQNQDQKPNNSKLNPQQAERMLNALRQEEKKLQQNVQDKQNKNGGVMQKDW